MRAGSRSTRTSVGTTSALRASTLSRGVPGGTQKPIPILLAVSRKVIICFVFGSETRLLSAGTFGYRGARATASVVEEGPRRFSLLSHAQLSDTDGDFPLVDDRCTALDPSDDVQTRRRNAHATDGSGLLHLQTDVFGGSLSAAVLGFARHGGA